MELTRKLAVMEGKKGALEYSLQLNCDTNSGPQDPESYSSDWK